MDSLYKIPQIDIPNRSGYVSSPVSSDFVYTLPDVFANPGETAPPKAGAAAETLGEQIGGAIGSGIVNPVTGFLTEHQTDYIVGAIGIMLIAAGVFALVKTASPV